MVAKEYDQLKDASYLYYNIANAKNFFGLTDPIRFIINIYILLSLILNAINFTIVYLNMKKKQIKLLLANWLLLGVLLMNFIHTATYLYEWVIIDKDEVRTAQANGIDSSIRVGALLFGNPDNMSLCNLQGFFLIFSSISQDFLINIFFYLIDSSEFNEFNVKLTILILGILFPFFFTLSLGIGGAIGLNDKFCYVRKYDCNITISNSSVTYVYTDNKFQVCVMIVYFIRIINCSVTAYFLVKIIKYVRKEKQPNLYLFKLIFIPSIQVFTIGIGVLYRFINLIEKHSSVSLAAPYLLLNTADGFLFPIGFALQNGIFYRLKMIITGQPFEVEKKENQVEFMFVDKESHEIDDL